MKRITALILSVLLAFGLAATASGAPLPTPGATLGFSAQNTVPNGGVATASIPGGTIKAGDSFTVSFNVDAIHWSATGNGAFEAGLLHAGWLQMAGAVPGLDFQAVGIGVDPATGQVTATVQALRAFTGQVTFSLNGGAGQSTAIALALTVEEVPGRALGTTSGGTAPTLQSVSLSLKTGETLRFLVPGNNFQWDTSVGIRNAASITDTGWVRINGANPGTDFSVSYDPSSDGSGDVSVVLTALRAATYNNLSISLLGGGGSATPGSNPVTVTVANSGDGKITGIASDARLGGTWSGALLNSKAVSYAQLGGLTVQGGDVLLLPLDAGFFTWSGTPPYSYSGVTRGQLREGKVELSVASQRGKQAVKSGYPKLEEKNGRMYVSIEFSKDAFTKGKDIDFTIRMYLTVNGSRHTGSELLLDGTLEQEVYNISGEDYVDLSDGAVIEPDEYIRDIELYLGQGISVHARLMEGRKYSGKAYHDISAADEKIMEQYPSIEQIITLKTLNLDRAGNKVSFDFPGENYYVYDSEGKYLGRSTQKVPYSSKYYLSTKSIEMNLSTGNSGGSEPDTIDIPEEIPVTPPNANANPGTGWWRCVQ